MTSPAPTPLSARSRLSVAVIVLALLTIAAGCGDVGAGSSDRGGHQPTTARALAAIVEDHLGDKVGPATSARPGYDVVRAAGGVGAELRYPADDEPTKPSVSLGVGTKAGAREFTCKAMRSQHYDGCVGTHGGVLFWQEGVPEEDPGVVYVALRKGPATVLMFMSGPLITEDPRDLDLRISVEDLFSIAGDDRVDVTTSRSAIEAGQTLKSWKNNG